MYLLEALKIKSADGIDFTRPLEIGSREFSLEAVAEIERIISGGDYEGNIQIEIKPVPRPIYWSVEHKTAGPAEVFGFIGGAHIVLPTAVEVAIVRALAAAPPEDHEKILSGGAMIYLGPQAACDKIFDVARVIQDPLVGSSIFCSSAKNLIVDENVDVLLNNFALECIASSLRTAPLKFRFIELYRIIEARFISDVKARLLSRYDAEPIAALSDAMDALKSEFNQLTRLAEGQKSEFEDLWITIDDFKKTGNKFSYALFRSIEVKGRAGGGKFLAAAALIYQIRCSIVHAGERDMIFEKFPDADGLLTEILPKMERIVMLLVGIDFI